MSETTFGELEPFDVFAARGRKFVRLCNDTYVENAARLDDGELEGFVSSEPVTPIGAMLVRNFDTGRLFAADGTPFEFRIHDEACHATMRQAGLA